MMAHGHQSLSGFLLPLAPLRRGVHRKMMESRDGNGLAFLSWVFFFSPCINILASARSLSVCILSAILYIDDAKVVDETETLCPYAARVPVGPSVGSIIGVVRW